MTEIECRPCGRFMPALVLGAALIASGCAGSGQPSLKVDYYTLEYEPRSESGTEQLPYVIEVKRFAVSPEVNSERIIFRDSRFRRNEYTYHRWRANPADLVTFYLARDLRTSGLFAGAYAVTSSMQPTHFLEGAVDGFHEYDGPNEWEGVVSLNVMLIDRLDPDPATRVLFQKQYEAREPCARKNPEALAEAMSRAMSRLSGAITRDVHQHLAHIRLGREG